MHVTVNELSGSIDLQSTLIRAEALFRRFQRTVEAVDRKHHFPTPSNVRQRLPQPAKAGPSGTSTGAATSNDAGKRSGGPASTTVAMDGTENDGDKVISPELRHLLSREVDKLDKREVKQHGGGIGN